MSGLWPTTSIIIPRIYREHVCSCRMHGCRPAACHTRPAVYVSGAFFGNKHMLLRSNIELTRYCSCWSRVPAVVRIYNCQPQNNSTIHTASLDPAIMYALNLSRCILLSWSRAILNEDAGLVSTISSTLRIHWKRNRVETIECCPWNQPKPYGTFFIVHC